MHFTLPVIIVTLGLIQLLVILIGVYGPLKTGFWSCDSLSLYSGYILGSKYSVTLRDVMTIISILCSVCNILAFVYVLYTKEQKKEEKITLVPHMTTITDDTACNISSRTRSCTRRAAWNALIARTEPVEPN